MALFFARTWNTSSCTATSYFSIAGLDTLPSFFGRLDGKVEPVAVTLASFANCLQRFRNAFLSAVVRVPSRLASSTSAASLSGLDSKPCKSSLFMATASQRCHSASKAHNIKFSCMVHAGFSEVVRG